MLKKWFKSIRLSTETFAQQISTCCVIHYFQGEGNTHGKTKMIFLCNERRVQEISSSSKMAQVSEGGWSSAGWSLVHILTTARWKGCLSQKVIKKTGNVTIRLDVEIKSNSRQQNRGLCQDKWTMKSSFSIVFFNS